MDNQNSGINVPPPLNQKPSLELGGLKYYYQNEFNQIHDSEESYKGKWNWFAFLFSWMWCFSTGCWGFALVILGTALLTFGVGIGPFVVVGWAIIMGWRGTWFYYNVKIKNKQFPNSLN